ncbi:peptidoglycan endopeptidase [uncultured Sphingomonas sp.]|uniref:peptidoglycan endopeptidase n=1 Tax=uncultured Sphingomonas sp. TaxID=158754 RepID=UPI0025F1AAA4|nr:peptidoglycan endopeptidase [uncultured Sphingomonas sp.]
MGRSEEIVARARACVGARFRPHGRDPAFGLDCVGVAAVAFRRDVPTGYPLRGGHAGGIAGIIDRMGLIRVAGASQAGDLLLLRVGHAQFHLAVRTGEGFVHADAGLRRVVETPGEPVGDMVACWREAH